MVINRKVLFLVELALGLVVLAGVAAASWFLLNIDTDTTVSETRAQLTRLEASAEVYFGRLRYFDGVCTDIGVPANYRCHSNSTEYAIEAPLGGGHYYCLDSQGFFSQTVISKGEATSCRRY